MTTTARTIAIGDVHGCSAALERILELVSPAADDTVITLGDYVNRGPDSRGVIERLIRLADQCHLVPLLGNHDELFLAVCGERADLREAWLGYGGDATLASYGNCEPEEIPEEHLMFLRHCPLWYETERHFFVHGSYEPDRPLADQSPVVLLWESLKQRYPGPHVSGKTAIVGHSSQKSGEVLDLGYLQCIDTRCFDRGWLTALEVETGRLWQVDKFGKARG